MTKRASSFKACCYNILNNNQSITASNGNVKLPYDETVISTTILPTSITFTNTWYEYGTSSGASNLATVDFSTRIVADLSATTNNFFAKLNNIKYSYSNTNSGYGLAKLEIDLPRNAVRGMQLDIIADFSKMKISNL